MKTILRPSGESSFAGDAIRDLVVVVVGILAALYLESWWQDRQDRAEENLLLDGLRTEFVANKSQLTQKMSVWSDIIIAANVAQQLMGKNGAELDPTKVVQAFQGTNSMQFFDPRTGQLSSLISSGKLGLIENAELRAKIADWPSLVEDLNVEREIAMLTVTTEYRSRLESYLSPVDDGPFENRIEELLSDREIYNDLFGTRLNMQRSVDEGLAILQASDDIIAMIDSELGQKIGSEPGSDPN
jgi:hypothetical protein